MTKADPLPPGETSADLEAPAVVPKNRPKTGDHGVVLTLAYDGARFAGWAKQATQRTIAGELEGAIRAIDPRASAVRGVSRTDAGVHARCQVASFDSYQDLDARSWVLALARHLPSEIAVIRAARVPAGYDARRFALWKHYRYLIFNDVVRDPFLESRAWRLGYSLVLERMQEEAQLLLGEHDFQAFRGAADARVDTIRRLSQVDIQRDPADPRILVVNVVGDRFLYNMVRIIVGTLIDVGRGRLPPGTVTTGFSSGKRAELGMTAPPDGLYLMHIELAEPGENPWPAAPTKRYPALSPAASATGGPRERGPD